MPLDPWPAPTAAGPIDADVSLPGSKSITNRALVLGALADAPSTIERPLRSRDTMLMVAALRSLGVVVEEQEARWLVRPPASPRGGTPVDVGNAGTVMRFVPPVAALADGDVTLDGDPRARQRPLGPLLDGLRVLGARIDDGDRGGLPITVRGRGGIAGGAVIIDASGSSQLVSGLLLSAPRFAKGVEVRHAGPPVPSAPHIEMTVAMLRTAGAHVDAAGDSWRVEPGPLSPGTTVIEPDLSNAAPFAAGALATGGRVRIAGWPRRSIQPGGVLPELLERMGGHCELTDDGLTVRGGGTIAGIDADLRDAPELTMTIAALAVLADSPSRLRGVAHIRHQETDRLAALCRELGRLGGDITELDDGLEIRPGPLSGGVFSTYDDHRIATAAAVVGLVVPGVLVENVATTGKTLPDFPARWQRMLTSAGRGEAGSA